MNLSSAVVCVIAAAWVRVGVAHADLATGRDKFISGDYKTAATELSKVVGKDRTAARLLLARVQAATGDYAAAEATLLPLTAGKDAPAAEARMNLAFVRVTTGKIADARKDLEALYKDRPDDRGVRTALGLVRYWQGDILGSKALFDETVKESDAQKLNLDDAPTLIQLALAARYTSNFQLSNDAFREALKLDPKLTDAGVEWADLFLQKYAAPLAEQTLEEVFKVNPNHPDAHAAMAEVIVETRYDLAAVRHHVDAALAVNPKNARALKVNASISIDQNQWDAAKKLLDTVLAANPQDTEAIAMKATIAWLRDDIKLYDTERQKAFAVNPNYAELYRIVARSAVREHRYVEAIELEKEAVKLRPSYYEAMAGAGLGYLRLGMEKEGLEWIEKSWVGDQYNVRTYNTRDLFKNTIPKDYSIANTKSFRIRYHNEERPVLSRFLEPTLEKAFADMVRRYGFTPSLPTTLELYADRTDYAIRTVGLPDLGALGVCFGKVITAMSPATGDINWGMVLWHELGHVFAIQLSSSRVPRWFTEGLSEYETLIAHPSWRRENDADLYGAMVNNTLPSIAALNQEFMQPDTNAVVVAYYQSAVTIEFLVQSYGFPKIVEALKLFGKGKETPEVLQIITKKTIPQLDADFRAYLEVRLKPYAGTFKLPTRGFDDVTKLEIAADASPRDGKLRAMVALGHYYAGDADKAAVQAAAALALDPKQPHARYILAEIALHKNDAPKAKTLVVGLIADGHDNYDLRTRLAQIAEKDANFAEVEKQLCAAKKLDPERSYPYQELSSIYKKAGDVKRSLIELEHYAFLEQMELAPLKELIAGYTKLGNWAKVKTYADMATFIAPHDPDVLAAIGKSHIELGDGSRALFAYDTMLLLKPAPRRPAIVHIGRAKALFAANKKVEARAALAQAMKTEPENAEALELKAKLK
ncbi:MAG: tetratricopeptide repeat protein [Deltaproteobacteria bacterium]|nr:tetratricopeptide repeat protein [Deltaproteobacteria bacterium]